LQQAGVLRRPEVPADCEHNAHIYFVMLASGVDRDGVLHAMRQNGIAATFHYVPLHSAPAGLRYGRAVGDLQNTVRCAGQLVRLPLWVGMTEDDQLRVVTALHAAVSRHCDMQAA
jgi:dTDP-4-amino-4,6-dideoxygalactose transaminase